MIKQPNHLYYSSNLKFGWLILQLCLCLTFAKEDYWHERVKTRFVFFVSDIIIHCTKTLFFEYVSINMKNMIWIKVCKKSELNKFVLNGLETAKFDARWLFNDSLQAK